MMMGIDDGEIRLQDFFLMSLSQPVCTGREDPAESLRGIVVTHLISGFSLSRGTVVAFDADMPAGRSKSRFDATQFDMYSITGLAGEPSIDRTGLVSMATA